MRKAAQEVIAFRDLLETFDPSLMLVNYTHQILCETHANEFVKLGQPPNMFVDGVEYGPCGLQGFVEIKQWGVQFPLSSKIEDVENSINRTIQNKVLRKQDSTTIGKI